jgi:hypothetical protein
VTVRGINARSQTHTRSRTHPFYQPFPALGSKT